MALQFILGGSGSGKSACLYQMIIERSMAYPDEKILLIVPEQYTMQTQKHIVEAHPRHSVMNVDILSFERLAYRVFDELGQSQKEILEDTGKSMIIRRILAEHQDELHAFRGNIRKQGFIEQVKSMISELLQYGITPQMLEEKSHELGMESVLYGKLQDIQVIYKAFLEIVHEKYMTTEEVPDRLCDVIERSELVKHSVIYVDNFTGFTPIQYKLMTQLLMLSPLVVMTLTVDTSASPFRPSDMENLFYMPKDTIAHLLDICHVNHIDRVEDILLDEKNGGRFDACGELAMLERQVFRGQNIMYDAIPERVEAYELSDPRSEMAFVAMRIHDYIAKKNYVYKDIAVVTSDMNRYRNGAEFWFGQYKIPCFFDGRRSISGNMLVEWSRSLLNVLIQNFSYEAMFRYLRCGFSGIKMDDIDVLENYVLALGIRGYARWNKEWTAKIQNMSDENLGKINELRLRLIEPMTELYTVSKDKKRNTVDLLRAIYRYMCHMNIRAQVEERVVFFEEKGDLSRSKEYEQIYDVMIDLFDRINLILGKEHLSIKEFSDIFEAGISDVKIGIIPPGIDQITFGDLRRTRLDGIKILFFVGLNDGLVPLVESGGGLITDVEREKLASHKVKLAPTARENTCTEQFYLYTTLTKASERLILSCSSQDASGREQRISSVFADIQQVFPGLAMRKVVPVRDRLDYHDVNHAYQYLIHGLRGISENAPLSDEWMSVYDWFHSHPEYKEKTENLVDAAFYRHWDEQLSKAAVKAVYEEELTGGVTMLEKYAACAYAHFLTYGVKLQERKVYQIQAPDIGMMFHQAIERFSVRIGYSGYAWRDIPDDARDHMVEECVHSVVLEYNFAVMQDSMRGHYLTEKILRMTKRTIWALQQQLKKGDFDPVGYEMRFTTELETNSMKIQYGEEGVLSLNGKIDRMDICEDEGRRYLKIIDYKSGKTSFDLAAVYQGLQLQLMVYMNAAQETEQKNHPECIVIPAGILYYHIDDPLIHAERASDFFSEEDGSNSDGQIKILEELAVDGLVVDDTEIIMHMDREPGAAPKVLPVSYKKNGELTAYSSAAKPENFEVLAWHVKNRTHQIGKKIFSGDISVNPYSYNQKTACDFCNYRVICGFDPAVKGYEYHKIRKMKKDEVWAAIMKEVEE